MPSLTTYLLQPIHERLPLALHFGRQGIGYEGSSESWASDSLFAALVTQAALLEGMEPQTTEPPTFAQPFVAGVPPFVHSSLFPRIHELVLLPRPALDLCIPDPELRGQIGKGFKTLRYLSPALFRAVGAREPIVKRPMELQGGKVWISMEELDALPKPWRRAGCECDNRWRARLAGQPIWTVQQVPRVTVDRVTSASAFYEVGRVVFAEGCGLALLVQYQADQQAAWSSRLFTLLELLGESGIGGRRSSGYGAFRIALGKDMPFADPATGGRAVLLSRYLPRPDELGALRATDAAYQLVTVGGWVFSLGVAAQQRQQITLVAEGSVVAPQGRPLVGTIADVRPSYQSTGHPFYGHGFGTAHPVYRSGLALAVPIPATEADHATK